VLIRSDPFRDIDRWMDEFRFGARERTMPMDAYRHGDELVLDFDVPGVDPNAIDLTVEQDMVRVTAKRDWLAMADDEFYVRERPVAEFSRQVMLGAAVDSTKVTAHCENGVLTVRLPIAESARKRQITIERPGQVLHPTAAELASVS
jgi:HSP20 family protein